MNSLLLTLQEASVLLGWKPKRLYEHRKGDTLMIGGVSIPIIRDGKQYYVRRADLVAHFGVATVEKPEPQIVFIEKKKTVVKEKRGRGRPPKRLSFD